MCQLHSVQTVVKDPEYKDTLFSLEWRQHRFPRIGWRRSLVRRVFSPAHATFGFDTRRVHVSRLVRNSSPREASSAQDTAAIERTGDREVEVVSVLRQNEALKIQQGVVGAASPLHGCRTAIAEVRGNPRRRGEISRCSQYTLCQVSSSESGNRKLVTR